MNILVLSDLHLEFEAHYPFVPMNTDVCVLAGDIHQAEIAALVAVDISRTCEIPVVLVAGNHEHYGRDIEENIALMRKRCNNHDVNFLENDAVVISGVRFLGCTLWTDFTLGGEYAREINMRNAEFYINDFRLIKNKGGTFSAEDAEARCIHSKDWLRSNLAQPFSGKTVVVTHFAPHTACVHERFIQSNGDFDDLTPYFTTDCSDIIETYKPDLWLYGHTHNSIDKTLSCGTRLVSNQRGYPGESQEFTKFSEDKLIVV